MAHEQFNQTPVEQVRTANEGSTANVELTGWQQEYVGACLASQADTQAQMHIQPTEIGAQQTILQCIELSKIQSDGTFKN